MWPPASDDLVICRGHPWRQWFGRRVVLVNAREDTLATAVEHGHVGAFIELANTAGSQFCHVGERWHFALIVVNPLNMECEVTG